MTCACVTLFAHPLFLGTLCFVDSLYVLTVAEQSAFDRLPANLRDGWNVRPSRDGVFEAPERRLLRARLVRLHSKPLRSALDALLKCSSETELSETLSHIDVSEVHSDDVLELVFAIGPEGLSSIILQMLKTATTDQDVLGIAALSFLREELLLASTS